MPFIEESTLKNFDVGECCTAEMISNFEFVIDGALKCGHKNAFTSSLQFYDIGAVYVYQNVQASNGARMELKTSNLIRGELFSGAR